MSSSVSCGLVGLPNVGKSTLFNALTDAGALVANYPFATIDPNVGIVAVRDERLEVLAKMFDSEKIVPATINITDIAGLVEGANQGEGLGNQFLSHIRSCQAMVQVVRAFNDSSVASVGDNLDPQKSISIINTELILADLETIDRRLAKMEKEAKANPKLKDLLESYLKAKRLLDSGQPLTAGDEDFSGLNDLQLLTLQPTLYVFNMDENSLSGDQIKKELTKLVAPSPALFICAKLEAELNQLDEEDRSEMLESYGQKESGLIQLSKSLYDLLGLQSFLTAGKKEVRAWTIKRGALAPQAAGVIHSDFERGFIAAEVVSYKDLLSAGSWQAARTTGVIRTEGKTYQVKNDDVIEFRFNVKNT